MAAAILSPHTRGIAQSEPTDIDVTRLWRAHITPADWRKPELTAFVEAGTATAAARRIAAVIATSQACTAVRLSPMEVRS